MKRLLSALLLCSTLTIPVSASFKDASGPAINFVQQRGMVQGYADGSFQPTSTINRAEFIKILVSSAFSTEEIMACDMEDLSLTDVPRDSWYAPYVCFAASRLIINTFGNFRPADPVNLAEAAKIMSITFALTPLSYEIGDAWYQDYLDMLQGRGALLPLAPGHLLRRSEAAEMLYLLLRDFRDNVTLRHLGEALFTYRDGKIFAHGYCDDPDTGIRLDLPTMQIHGGCYIADKNAVYYGITAMGNADPATFTLLQGYGKVGPSYAKDAKYVYVDSTPLTVADVASFTYLGRKYGKDSKHVYLLEYVGDNIQTIILEGADPKSFRLFGEVHDPYGTDGTALYAGSKKIEGADLATFTLLSDDWRYADYARDKNHIYVDERILAEADYATFTYLADGYAKDKNHVYSSDGTIEPMADAATFELLENGFARDKNHRYTYMDVLTVVD